MIENGIKRRTDDLVSVGEQIKGVRQDTREAISGGELRFMERRRRNNREAAEFNQFKQASRMYDTQGGRGGCVLDVMHGCSRMTIDHRIPTSPGRSTSDFLIPGRLCLHQARCAVRCSASRMKAELHSTKNCFSGGFSCVWVTASMS